MTLVFFCWSFFQSIVVFRAEARLPEFYDSNLASGVFKWDGHYLLLNGKAIHSVFVFKIYEIFLYLENRSHSANKILKSSERKLIFMKFLRDVSGSQLKKALNDGFLENCASHCEVLKKYMNLIHSKIGDFNEGDTLQFFFLPSKMIFKSSRGEYLEIDEPLMNTVILSIWLGPDPPSEGVKNGILGRD